MRVKDGATYYVLIGAWRAPTHPVWVYNLHANPSVEIRARLKCRLWGARGEDEAERRRLWEIAVRGVPAVCGVSDTADTRRIPSSLRSRSMLLPLDVHFVSPMPVAGPVFTPDGRKTPRHLAGNLRYAVLVRLSCDLPCAKSLYISTSVI